MNKTLGKENSIEYLEITKMILKGSTIAQIAKCLNYSESTVSNRLNDLMQKYSAKNRFEFIYNFFSKIIQKYKTKLEFINMENEHLKKNLIEIKNIIQNFEANSASLDNITCETIKETDF